MLVVVDDLLRQRLREDVSVGQEAHVLGGHHVQYILVGLLADFDRFPPVDVGLVDVLADGFKFRMAVRSGHMHDSADVPQAFSESDDLTSAASVHENRVFEGVVEADAGGGVYC